MSPAHEGATALASMRVRAHDCSMESSLYTRAQRAVAELKGVVYELVAASGPEGLTNAEIGRTLGIYQGHVRHQGHVSRTILAMLQAEDVLQQNAASKRWTVRRSEDLRTGKTSP
jgi:hypothetical protein